MMAVCRDFSARGIRLSKAPPPVGVYGVRRKDAKMILILLKMAPSVPDKLDLNNL